MARKGPVPTKILKDFIVARRRKFGGYRVCGVIGGSIDGGGSPTPSFPNERSVLFDGVNEVIRCGTNLDIEKNDPVTISFWIKTTTTTAHTMIVGKTALPLGHGGYYVRTWSSGRVLWNFGDSVGYVFQQNSTATINDGSWHHVTCTYDGSMSYTGMKVYVDGIEGSSNLNTNSLATNLPLGATFSMGAYYSGSAAFDGQLDEVSVWDRELDQDEVDEIYHSGAPTNLIQHSAAANLIGWWRMGDEDTYPTLTDNSSNSNNGTMINMESGDIVTDVP